jgi:hypothetical protein
LVRSPLPTTLLWDPTDGVVRDHYWLRNESPAGGQRLEARLAGNELRIAIKDASKAEAWLDARLVDMNANVVVIDGDAKREVAPAPSLGELCRTMWLRGDPQLAASWRLPLN